MSQLDDLLAQRAAGAVAAVPGAVPAGAAPAASSPLDAMLAARASGATLPTAPPPAPDRSALQQVGDFLEAGVHHVANLPWSAGQLVANGIAAPFKLAPNNSVSHAVMDMADSFNHTVAQREAAYQAGVPNSPGAIAGATVGTIAPMFAGGLAGGLQGAGDAVGARAAALLPKAVAPLGAKVVSGATQGAAVGAAQPVTDMTTLSDLVTGHEHPGYWSQKGQQVAGGAAFGGAIPVASTGVGAAWRAAKEVVANSPILSPAQYAARQVGIQLGADAPTVANDLANAPQYVPGSVPTSAQAGADPRLVMLEKALATNNAGFKAQLEARANANNAARLQAVANVAQTPEALQAAIDSRNAATAPMRARVVDNGNPVPVGGVSGAISGVANGPLGVSKTIGPAAEDMASKVRDFTTVTPPNTLLNTPGSATASPAMLDALRKETNTYLSKYAPSGFVGTQEQAAMTPVKGAIIDAIDAANPRRAPGTGGWGAGLEQAGPTAPGYRDYLAEFARRSVPINTMEVGQQLQGKLLAGGLNSSGDAAAALPGYRSALAQALRNSDFEIDPQAQAALEGVQSDLQRATISNSIRAAGGSDTAYNQGAGKEFLRAVGAADPSNIPAALAGAGTMAATGSGAAAAGAVVGAKKAGSFVTDRVANALGDLLLDPQKLAQALSGGSQPLSATAPSAFGKLTGQLPPAAKLALIGQLLKSQAPQVVGADNKQREASQP